MITIEQPSMALNSEDVTGPHYKMYNTWTVARNKTENAAKICGWIRTVAKSAPGGRLKLSSSIATAIMPSLELEAESASRMRPAFMCWTGMSTTSIWFLVMLCLLTARLRARTVISFAARSPITPKQMSMLLTPVRRRAGSWNSLSQNRRIRGEGLEMAQGRLQRAVKLVKLIKSRP